MRLPAASCIGATAPEIVPPGPNAGTEFVPNSFISQHRNRSIDDAVPGEVEVQPVGAVQTTRNDVLAVQLEARDRQVAVLMDVLPGVNVAVAKSETMMLSAVNDVPASPTAAGFQVNSGSVVNAEAFEQATSIAAAKTVLLNVGDWKSW